MMRELLTKSLFAGLIVGWVGCGGSEGEGEAEAESEAESEAEAEAESEAESEAEAEAESESESEGEEVTACDDYCDCMETTCNDQFTSTFGDAASCLADCELLAPGEPDDTEGDTLSCRAYHCEAARTSPETHCPHANGEAICVN